MRGKAPESLQADVRARKEREFAEEKAAVLTQVETVADTVDMPAVVAKKEEPSDLEILLDGLTETRLQELCQQRENYDGRWGKSRMVKELLKSGIRIIDIYK